MDDTTENIEIRKIEVLFVKEHKHFIKKYDKKKKTDYVLNVNKIIKDKINSKFIIPNKIQAFVLNYEIKKLLDKAINIKNNKYCRIVYLNSDLSASGINNTISFLNAEYDDVDFSYSIVDIKDDFVDEKIEHKDITIIK